MIEAFRDRIRSLHRPNRREFLISAGAVTAGALLLDATAIDRHDLTVERQTIHIRNLPSAFQGFQIAQISDFHHRGYCEDFYLRHVVEQVNALTPEMVALTGDFITAHGNPFGPWRTAMPLAAAILSGLKAPLRICTLGNHDCIDPPFVMHSLKQKGLTVLRNQHTAIEKAGQRLWIAGSADAYFDYPDLGKTIPQAREGEPIILLGHEPDFADVVRHYGGVDLMLAGHSHGGQVRVPGVTEAFLPVMGRRYVRGHFQFADMQLYVNRGIGAVHLPIRFRCPPEITLFTLQPAP